jgi:hypothetical protein
MAFNLLVDSRALSDIQDAIDYYDSGAFFTPLQTQRSGKNEVEQVSCAPSQPRVKTRGYHRYRR